MGEDVQDLWIGGFFEVMGVDSSWKVVGSSL